MFVVVCVDVGVFECVVDMKIVLCDVWCCEVCVDVVCVFVMCV